MLPASAPPLPPPGTNPYLDPEVALATAHHLYIQPDGLLRPMVLRSYLTNPRTVWATAAYVLGEKLLQGIPRATDLVKGVPEPVKTLDFLCGDEIQGNLEEPVNLAGSVVSVLCGRVPYPMRGLIVVMREPDPDSEVRRKMTPTQKTTFRNLLIMTGAVLTRGPAAATYPKTSVDTVLSIASILIELDAELAKTLAENPVQGPQREPAA